MGSEGAMTNGEALVWSGRVLAADDLRRALNGHREVVLPRRTIVTPLAAEELRSKSIRIVRKEDVKPQTAKPPAARAWGQGQERPYPLVESAVRAVARDGVPVTELPACGSSADRWAKAVAECVAAGTCCGGVVFCDDPGLVCCIANKVAGLRAVPVVTVGQAARATLTLGANLLAVEMPGRTFFEIKQILRIACACDAPVCPPGVACTLREVEADAHR